LDKLAKALLADETIEEDQVAEILKDTVLPEEAKLY
jgi:ATP-dependent Zn protease